jgi:SulP family sulfate permease
MSFIKQWVPIFEWLPNYQKADLRGDMVAGITVAMMLIPQAMSYALLAGLDPIIGLYASILPLVIYAMFGTSRQLGVGPVAMVALLVASGVGAIAEPGSARYIELAIVLALMVGVIQLAMGVFRLGFLTNFMSHPVISGFTTASALIIGLSQLKHIVGLPLPRTENIVETLWLTIQNFADIHWITFAIGLGGVVLLLILKRLSPLIPGPMVAVILSTLVVWFFGLHETGVKIVSEVPAGLPPLSVPEFAFSDLSALLPIALTISFVGFMESIAVAKKIAQEKRYEIDSNKELIGLGLANIVGSFFKAMPVTGGFSRTAVNKDAGAVLIAIALLFFTPLFYYIPKAILGSVIMVAVFGLVDIHEIKHLWKVKRTDLVLLVFTVVVTLTVGVVNGIFSGIAASMIWFVVRTTRPHYAVLGRIPNTSDFRNEKNYGVEKKMGVLALRFDAQFYYGNVSFLKETIKKHELADNSIHSIVMDASAINQLDSSADTALHELVDDYLLKDISFYFSSVKQPVLDVMKKSGFYQKLGKERFFMNTHNAVEAAKASQ